MPELNNHPQVASTPTPMPKPTLLYGIQPRGLGTAEVESLYSLLLRIAHAHHLPPSKMVNVTMAGDPAVNACLTPSGKAKEISRAHWSEGWGWGWGWDKHAGKSMIGTGPSAGQWAKALETATGVEGLLGCTLRDLRNHVSDAYLVTDEERVCLACLQEDMAQGELPYERLLWRLGDVKCCAKHRTPLVPAKCGRSPSEAQDPYLRVKHPGTCSGCGAIGFTCLTPSTEKVHPGDLWRAEQCAALISDIRPLRDPLKRQKMKKTLRAKFALMEGGQTEAGERAGACKSGFSDWITDTVHRTSLGQHLDLAAAHSLSVSALLHGTWEAASVPESAKVPRRKRKQTHTLLQSTIKDMMMMAIVEGQSASELARALHVDISTLAQHTELYAQMRQATITRQESEDEKRQSTALDEAASVVRRLVRKGRPVTLRNAGEETGSTWFPAMLRSQALLAIHSLLVHDRVPSYIKVGSKLLEAARSTVVMLREELDMGRPD